MDPLDGTSNYTRALPLWGISIGKEVGLVKIIDSSSYELTQIACGNAEIYVLVSVPHDVATGTIIIQEAGGRVTDFEGKEWNINSKGIVATNGKIHNKVLSLRDKTIFG